MRRNSGNLRSLKCSRAPERPPGHSAVRQGPPVTADTSGGPAPAEFLAIPVMTEKFTPPMVTIRRYAASRICDVVVVVRGQEMVIRCPSYSHALKWARLECKSYGIPEPIDFPDNGESDDDVPLFLRPDRN
jgi:hypothetical protein